MDLQTDVAIERLLHIPHKAWVVMVITSQCNVQRRLVPGSALGDKDSRFTEFEGVSVHWKCYQPVNSPVKAAIHCFHGFGANVESWDNVQKRLAESASAVVSAHDTPGFGLTDRYKHTWSRSWMYKTATYTLMWHWNSIPIAIKPLNNTTFLLDADYANILKSNKLFKKWLNHCKHVQLGQMRSLL